MAFPQAKPECDMYMEIPRGCNVGGWKHDYVLRLNKNLYGSKQASKLWFEHLKRGLRRRGFKQSKADKCVFYKGNTIFVVYVDNGILIGPDKNEIDNIIASLKENYDLTDEGNLNEYLGIKIEKQKDGSRILTQPLLMRRILIAVGINPKRRSTKKRRTPAIRVLQKDEGGHERRYKWDYQSVVGMLNFLTRSTRPDIAFAVSQVARFMSCPMKSHKDAVIRICEYIRDTVDKGIVMKPQKGKGFEVYADADFSGGYHKGHTNDPSTAKSRSSYYILYEGCLIYFTSKLQSEIALSTTEAEYICLSQAMRTTKVLMRFFKELEKHIKEFESSKPNFKCKAFEDNNGALHLASAPQMRPRTKHINIKYHHFRSMIGKEVTIEKVATKDQLADIGTKPLTRKPFEALRRRIIGW